MCLPTVKVHAAESEEVTFTFDSAAQTWAWRDSGNLVTKSDVYELGSTSSHYGSVLSISFVLKDFSAPAGLIDIEYYTNTSNDILQSFVFGYSINGTGEYVIKENLSTGINNVSFEYGEDCRTVFCYFRMQTNDTWSNLLMSFKINGVSIVDMTPDEEVDTTKNIFELIRDFFGSFFEKIKNTIVGVFVPDDGYVENWTNDIKERMEKRLAGLIYPFSFVEEIISAITSFDSSGDVILTFPRVSWDVKANMVGSDSESSVDVIPETVVNLTETLEPFSVMVNCARVFTSVVCVGWSIHYIQHCLDVVLGRG